MINWQHGYRLSTEWMCSNAMKSNFPTSNICMPVWMLVYRIATRMRKTSVSDNHKTLTRHVQWTCEIVWGENCCIIHEFCLTTKMPPPPKTFRYTWLVHSYSDKLKGYLWHTLVTHTQDQVKSYTKCQYLQLLMSSHVHWFCLKNECPLICLAPSLPSLLSLQHHIMIMTMTASFILPALKECWYQFLGILTHTNIGRELQWVLMVHDSTYTWTRHITTAQRGETKQLL